MTAWSGLRITRREFARRAAIVSAASMVSPNVPLVDSEAAQALPQQPAGTSSLSPESQAEAEARYQSILALYGSRFTDAQKSDLRRLSFSAQPPLDRLRAYDIENGDGQALYLKPLMEREKNPESAVAPRAASKTATKP